MSSLAVLIALGLALPGAGDDDDETLARKLQNPLSDLLRLPVQFDQDNGFGDRDADRFTLSLQPVLPMALMEGWNLVSRTILPVIYQEKPSSALDTEFGLGDALQSFFFSPWGTDPTWGFGPVVLVPIASDKDLGGEKWGVGPTGVLLTQDGPWTYGLLAHHLWSFKGADDRDKVKQTFLQPFVAYTAPSTLTVALNTEAAYDWFAKEWTVPINLTVGYLIPTGGPPLNVAVGGRIHADAPPDGPEWGVRVVVTLLFPQ